MSAASKIILRAKLLHMARSFFDKRGIIEVDCPMLLSGASIDQHIDLIACNASGKTRYLHSSPEYCMKRLLAEGVGDIYQLGHVFRDFEYGSRHNPEFTMAEWYRIGMPFEELIQETCDFIALFIGDVPRKTLSYKEAFLHYTALNPFTATVETLLAWIHAQGHAMHYNPETDTKDDLLSYIVASFIEPKLEKGCMTIMPYFPQSQAALAQVRTIEGDLVAERFEVFFSGYELANGYHELQDPVDQRARFIESNRLRKKMGKNELPIDELFLQALEKGFPDCSGVAVGFDRLVMLHANATSLADILPWNWTNS